jgi:hypothetical protein
MFGIVLGSRALFCTELYVPGSSENVGWPGVRYTHNVDSVRGHPVNSHFNVELTFPSRGALPSVPKVRTDASAWKLTMGSASSHY